MSEPAQSPQPQFQIEKLYVKDLSLEVPNAPEVFLQVENPQLEVRVRSEAKQFADGMYEVVVTVTVTARKVLRGETAEDRPPQNRGRAGVDLVVQADGFARGVEAGDRLAMRIECARARSGSGTNRSQREVMRAIAFMPATLRPRAESAPTRSAF